MSDDERPRLREVLARIDALVSALDRVADDRARDAARELLELVLDLHGLALARVMAIITSAEDGKELAGRLVRDEQVRAVYFCTAFTPNPPRSGSAKLSNACDRNSKASAVGCVWSR